MPLSLLTRLRLVLLAMQDRMVPQPGAAASI
jgi:hypothetical protein